jgi:hypothetical protein
MSIQNIYSFAKLNLLPARRSYERSRATIQETQNTTKAPNTDFLNNNDILEDISGNADNTSNDDVKVPTAP